MKLTIIRGWPGSGKSTFAHKNYRCLILENDMFQVVDGKYCWSFDGTKRAIGIVHQMAEMALANKSDVCIANTFTKRRFVDFYKNLADEYGVEFEVIRMTNEFDNVHNVPEHILKNMKESFEDYPDEKII